ncbi:NAD(P)H-hydrate epimerase [Bacillus niacini]|uniref:Bifunctional NAD(P)H-hydrate repair enzyme n=1 Tax=Neobacillus niacini TaxID=86668 RepID=A0A852T8K2_9BACI|nr:NAD(P)H-hydrate dehydratase [Neobacillus niacini]NYE04145.1 NAD(P)H-hydrate epimerase [Neobacillus niacini]
MFAAGQKEMQKMDQYTIEKLGLPGVVLMENAGARAVEEILKSTANSNPRVIVLAGGGNNGGDGFVIARRLFDLGLQPQLWILADPERIKGDAKLHLDVYMNRGLPLIQLQKNKINILQDELSNADIIIDAILGTGVNGPVREPLKDVISLVNTYAGKKMILSVDIPSGVSSDTGKVEGEAIKASKTITFVYPKKGFFLNQGPQHIGEWKAVDISVPPSIVEKLGLEMPKLITEHLAKGAIPIRPKHGHKGTFGHALIIGGSRQYVGAPIFSAKAALHSGAGLVSLAIPETIYPIVAAENPESLLLPLPDENGHFAESAIDELKPLLHHFDCVGVGPGISRFPNGEEWMKSLFSRLTNQPIVIDADALYLLRNQMDLLKNYKGVVILTPHPGEMSKLLNIPVKEVEENRLEIARQFAKEHSIYLLLKGHRSVIAAPSGELYINPHGHDALGKGGSGDILTGLIASFVAQGASPLHALISASYLHARAGEDRAKELSHYGVMPFDIIDGVKRLLNEI